MKLGFDYETNRIEFDVVLRKRKTLSIKIEPPNIITVIAPLRTSEKKILEMVQTKAKWISSKLTELSEIACDEEKEFITGERFLYLGQDIILNVVIDRSIKKSKAVRCEDKLYITVNAEGQDITKVALEAWYRQQAQEKILERIEYYQAFFNVTPRNIKIKAQKKRWGSCNSRHDLFFNWRCIMAPEAVLDYVVVHEMSHLIQLNHSIAFWNLVSKVLPDYQDSRAWLKKNGIRLNF